ncbi:LysR family transcriptional regulator [Salipiger sp. P9]|uniref:LysR family transcriptional regulator n=1 Tax=Salipiger pentaromativorans TaxID=2943193 RepID=UPI002158857F|nr:LysR family transcriptional regulator [Salipiger pentaromativorans]MCR8551108.1 LysR family transcriptional regulator [Salipiger pentaromativorans]
MDITLKQLEIFRWVVIAGSITKAAQRIGLSQPSVSQHLARLEETLDCQLIIRGRTGQIAMTPAGEFWFKSSEEMIGRISAIVTEHENTFQNSNMVLRLGTTPALRGSFTAAAARIAQQEPQFVKFELVYDLSSTLLVEQLRMHKINFAVVARSAIQNDSSSFALAKLFDDKIAWAVPVSISEADARRALVERGDLKAISPVLARYVEIEPTAPLRPASDDWYRHFLPSAMPVFGSPTFANSIEFVAAGLATCHIPMSLLPTLPQHIRSRVRLFLVPGLVTPTMLAMRKHLLTHPAYARIYRELAQYCRTEYAAEMTDSRIKSLGDLIGPEATLPVTYKSRTYMGPFVADDEELEAAARI